MPDDQEYADRASLLFGALRDRLDRTDELTAEMRRRLAALGSVVEDGEPLDLALGNILEARRLVQEYTTALIVMWTIPAMWKTPEEKWSEEDG